MTRRCISGSYSLQIPMRFDEQILKWQPFFITLATVAGTLIGLLFISLSLTRDKVVSNPEGFRLARRSFADFLHVVLVSLFFLIPSEGNKSLGIELFLVGILRIKLLVRQMKSPAGNNQKRTLPKRLSEFVMPILSTVGLLVAGAEIYQGGNDAIGSIYYVVVPVIAILLFNACSNAWLLLMEENASESR
jgi:cytochrome b561